MADLHKKDECEEAFSPPSYVKIAEVEVAVEAERVALEGKKLEKDVNKYDDWGDATNEEIEEAMRSADDWENRLCKIQDRIYSMKKNVQLYGLSSVELTKSTIMMEDLQNDMDVAIRVIKNEDEVRGIYSLSTSKASDVELPKFGGKPHENFAKFKVLMLKCFKSNKVRIEDQINKLRQSLFDQPKTLLPPSMGSISDAWEILENMYGDLSRVMNAKMLELRVLKENGGYPRKGDGRSLLKAQIDWITRLEVTLNEIADLGSQSAQLDRDAFGSRTIARVLELFPFKMQDDLFGEMEPANEDGKEQLYFIIKYLRDLRRRRQSMQRREEWSTGSSQKSKEKDFKSEQMKLKNEILEIRQKVYSKLNQGHNVLSIMQKFKSKVETLLRNYKTDLSFEEEKHWRDKMIITEKAVVKRSMELEAAIESCPRQNENLAPSVKEMFDAVRAQEMAIENLPEPPDVDDIEEKLERLKKFNRRFLNNSNTQAIANKVKVGKTKYVKKDVNKVGTNGNDVKMIEEKKDKNIFDIKRSMGTESCESEYDEVSNIGEEVVDVIAHETFENEDIRSINDKEYQAEVNEFNDWYYSKLDHRRKKVTNKTTKDLYDKIAPSTDSMDDRNDEIMYKQVLGGECNEVDKSVDASKIVMLLQAIFTVLLVTGKTVHEQSLQVSRLSKLSQPSLLSHLHPRASLSPRPPCSRQTTQRACCKVSSLMNAASGGVQWCEQVYSAFECAKMRTVKAVKVRLVYLLCHVIGPDFVRLQLADEDYKVKVKVH